MLLTVSFGVWSQEFVVSKGLKLKLPENSIVIHSGESILFKYPNWVLSHQLLDPASVNSPVDLTGLLNTYIKTLFGDNTEKLPKWLTVMASDQSSSYGITKGDFEKFTISNYEVYAVYDQRSNQGNIFSLGKGNVDYFSVIGNYEYYEKFLKILKER